MEREEIKRKVDAILVSSLGIQPEEIADGVRFKEDLGLDSLDYVDLLIHVEREFGVSITDDDAYHSGTIGQVYELVERYTR